MDIILKKEQTVNLTTTALLQIRNFKKLDIIHVPKICFSI